MNTMNKIHLLFAGLGAGNIGDETMFAGFLNTIHPGRTFSVEVWDKNASVIQTLPPKYTYITYTDHDACREASLQADLVLLVGDTPIMEDWGLEWPMRFHAQRLDELTTYGKPVHAVGVGVDKLSSREARDLFTKSHGMIASWTVRSQQCGEALLDLGVNPSQISVAADFAWLLNPEQNEKVWAENFLSQHGVNITAPILGVNVVNERWARRDDVKREIAHALDVIHKSLDIQIVFLCNETRSGEYFDFEAAKQVSDFMRTASVVLPNMYFTPSQMLALLACCDLTLSQRYHFTLLSILAGVPVLSFARGQKMMSLLKEFGDSAISGMDYVDGIPLFQKIQAGWEKRTEILAQQQRKRRILSIRAYKNLQFLPELGRHQRNVHLRVANVSELNSTQFTTFIYTLNGMASQWNLREFTNWSKVWEYPWLWFHGLSSLDWPNIRVLDFGSELSPMPWFFASLGAQVTMVETDAQWIPVWETIIQESGLTVDWCIVRDEILPFPDHTFDVVTSYSVIEHQPDKVRAINEVARILKPGGVFAISFDICEPEMGMTFPEWNGKALTMKEFEIWIWNHPAFDTGGQQPHWNVEDCDEFLQWHLQSASHHNYVVGAAILTRALR